MPSPLNHAEKAILMEKTRSPDGMGGYFTSWAESMEFPALITLDSSVEARLAEKSGVLDNYTVYVEKTLPIESGDYFKRKSDGAVFRITSSPDEQKTPSMSGMDFKVFTAAKTTLPTA